jgi:hypothetical protein
MYFKILIKIICNFNFLNFKFDDNNNNNLV